MRVADSSQSGKTFGDEFLSHAAHILNPSSINNPFFRSQKVPSFPGMRFSWDPFGKGWLNHVFRVVFKLKNLMATTPGPSLHRRGVLLALIYKRA
jgi:hypothetical protein